MNPKDLAHRELLRIASLLEKQEESEKLERHEQLLVDIAASLTGNVGPPSAAEYAQWCADLHQALQMKAVLGVVGVKR